MDYSGFTKEQLLERIDELELLNHELLTEKEQEIKLEYAWTGNLGHWYWNVKTNTVTFNPLKMTTLGYVKSEIPEHVTYQFFTGLLHPEDYQNTMTAMKDHLSGKAAVYETEYRIRAKDGKYKWYYDRGKITTYDAEGKPVFLAGIVFDITDKKELQLALEQKNRILEELSAVDGLTNISNHRTLIEILKSGIAEAGRTKKPLCAAIFDLDDFKKINDQKGHVIGDQTLVKVAELIRNNIRESDQAGRYGGEEFMVIFENTDLMTAVVVAERIRKAIEQHHFNNEVAVTVSGGVKQYTGETLTDMIHAADECLYKAKRAGKNQIVY